MEAAPLSAEEGPRQLAVYVHWTQDSGWVFVPRPSDTPEGAPGLSVKAPANEPPAGTQGRYIVLDCNLLNKAPDGSPQAPGSEDPALSPKTVEGARATATAVRRQGLQLQGLEATILQLEACQEKLRQRQAQDAGMRCAGRGAERGQGMALKAELEEVRARLEAEGARADAEKLRADQAQEELQRREQAARREIRLAGERLACTFQENVRARRELEGWEAEIKGARAQLETAAEEMREKREALLKEVAQHREEVKSWAESTSEQRKQEEVLRGKAEQLARDQAALEGERQRLEDLVAAERARLEAERSEHTDELRRCRAVKAESDARAERAARMQAELEAAREALAEEREKLAQDRTRLDKEGETLAADRERIAEERESASAARAALESERGQLASERQDMSEQARSLSSQAQDPARLFRSLVDGFAAARPQAEFPAAEERLVEDAKKSGDSSVFRDQLRVLEAAFAQKSEGGKQEPVQGADAADHIGGAAKGVVGALLALQGLQEGGDKKLMPELQEQLGFKTSKAANLGAASIHSKVRTRGEKADLRREEATLSHALSLVAACCLLWSSARKRMQGTVAAIRGEVQEVRRALPTHERGLEELQASLRQLFDAYRPVSTEKAREQYLKDTGAVVESVEELKRRIRLHTKSDCIGKLVEVSTRCYHAWETFEKHLLWQRRFLQLRRQGTPRPCDLRAMLLTSLADPEDEGAGLPRELASLVEQAARQRQAALAALRSQEAAGDGGALATPTRPSKRSRLAAASPAASLAPTAASPATSVAPGASPNSAHASVGGGRADALEARAATPMSPG